MTKKNQPKLISIYLKDTETNQIIARFMPNRSGEKAVEKYRGLAGLEIVKQYDDGGYKYESN